MQRACHLKFSAVFCAANEGDCIEAMNMNNFPRGFESATEHQPLPKWVMWLAAALVFGGYALLEYQDAQVEIVIQQARK